MIAHVACPDCEGSGQSQLAELTASDVLDCPCCDGTGEGDCARCGVALGEGEGYKGPRGPGGRRRRCDACDEAVTADRQDARADAANACLLPTLRDLCLLYSREIDAIVQPYSYPRPELTAAQRHEADRLQGLARRVSYRIVKIAYEAGVEPWPAPAPDPQPEESAA